MWNRRCHTKRETSGSIWKGKKEKKKKQTWRKLSVWFERTSSSTRTVVCSESGRSRGKHIKPKKIRLKIRLEKLRTRNTREISLVLILYSTEPDSIAWPHAKNRNYNLFFFRSSSAAVACFPLDVRCIYSVMLGSSARLIYPFALAISIYIIILNICILRLMPFPFAHTLWGWDLHFPLTFFRFARFIQ